MPKLTVTHIESPIATLKDDHGQTASLPLSFFTDGLTVGATVLVNITQIDRPLTHTLAHDVLTELLNPPLS